MTGTLWHSWAHEALVRTGMPFMQEVKLGRWMPEGWEGTADWIFWSDEYQAFVLGDMKTIKGDGITWIERDGAKTEHIWQLSCYWHALFDMGLPLAKGFGVLYWPKDRGSRPDAHVTATVQECEPLDRATVYGAMESRWTATRRYLEQVHWDNNGDPPVFGGSPQDWLNEHLADETERVQKVAWNPATKKFDLKLVPHWSTAYCPFEPPLCECSLQGITKIGHYHLDGSYQARKGFDHHVPTTAPTARDLYKRKEG